MLLDVNDILGKPYKAHARGPDAFDCYGLVIEVEKRLGKEMPDLYEKLTNEEIHNALITSKAEGYKKVKEAEFGDVVVLLEKGHIHHVGVCLKHGEFIHCDKQGVRISRLNEFSNKKEVYRCQN